MATRLYNRVVTDGLVLYLDAGNPKSYPGSGNNWYDLTSNNNTGTLVNGPIYSNGNLIFDGINEYATIPNQSVQLITVLTISVWVKSMKNNDTLQQGIVSKANLYGIEYGWTLRKGYGNSGVVGNDNKFYFSTGYTPYTRLDTSTYSNIEYTDNNWHYLTGVSTPGNINYLYVDGIKQTAYRTSRLLDVTTNMQPITIGTCYGDAPTHVGMYQNLFSGSIGIIALYNRALTDEEILQNYNTTKSRYII